MTNQEIAQILRHISQILGIQGENPFKIRAYVKAAQTIEHLTDDLTCLKEGGRISELPGIGERITKKIDELLETGRLGYYEELKKSEYAPLTEFLALPGMGPRHARLVYDKLGIKTVAALKTAAEKGQLKTLRGLGAKAEQNILQSIRQVQKYKERLPLAFILPRAELILNAMKKIRGIKDITLAGSIRRMCETVADVDILVGALQPEMVMDAFTGLPQTARIIAKGKTRSSIVTKEGFQVDLRVVAPESFGAAAHYFTGSKAHNIRIRSLGAAKGLKINEYGVFQNGKRIAGQTEAEIFKAVNLPYIAPELREDQGEIEAAQQGRLPSLIALEHIKGDLHVHSNWSDGAHTIEAMAAAAAKRGYRYIAICDHSPLVGITHGLDAKRLQSQRDAVAAVNSKMKGIRVLRGIEVDIRADGRLDLDEKVLRDMDLVVAAVHTKFNQSQADMTRRIIKAVENPHVDIIAHPTGRQIGKREPYDVGMDDIMEACKANKKVLELNACPERLDLSDRHCRMAKAKGIKIAISTDAHMDAHLDWITYGLATARRGWIEPEDVVNTLGTSRLLKFFSR